MSSIQSKITIHVKKPIVTHSKEEIRSIETPLEIIEIMQLAEKDF